MADETHPNPDQVNIEIAAISDVSGQVNVAGGNIVHAERGATVIIGAPAKTASGLLALSEMMQRSLDVRTPVVTFRADFSAAREQVDRLGDYKDLHDLLHKLQFHCFNGIALARTRFPNDDLALSILDDHALTLVEIAGQLRQIAARPSMSGQDLAWIDEVRIAGDDLREAIVALHEDLLKKVVWRLNRLLALQPARINILLNGSARDLRLPALLSALKLISETLSSLDLDTDKMMAFQSGVDGLGDLARILDSQVVAHDRWQALEAELRRIEGAIDNDSSELEMSWPDVRHISAPLYIDCTDEWADAMKKESEFLDKILNGGNPARLRDGFRRFQRLAAQRFYQVDMELKTLCGQMRQIGTPLAAVLEMIG